MFKSPLKYISAIAVAASVSLTAGSAFAGGLLKLGHSTSEGNAYHTFSMAFKDEVEKRTNGSVKVKVFCCFKMGGEQEMFQKLQLGTLDGTLIAQNNAGPFYPKIDLLVLPYMLQNYEHAVEVLDGPVGEMIFKDMPEEAGVHRVASPVISFRHIYNTKQAINTIEDFAPLKYRVPKNTVMVDTYKAFGSDPVPLAWSETLTAVQTGTVDGGDLPIDIIYSQKFHEVAKHIALTGHFVLAPQFFVSDKFMSKLTDEERTAVYEAAAAASEVSRKQILDNEASVAKTLQEDHGVTITTPEAAPFIEAAASVHSAFAAERGGDYVELIEAINAAAK